MTLTALNQARCLSIIDLNGTSLKISISHFGKVVLWTRSMNEALHWRTFLFAINPQEFK